MDYIDTAWICENGHLINDSSITYPKYNDDFCKKCGAKAIKQCPSCGKAIQGKEYFDNVIHCFSINIPAYCPKCGKPYPWTKLKLEALNELIDLMDELNEDEKNQLKESGRDISTENPKTELGVIKIKKYFKKVGDSLADAAKDILVQIASETALKVMEKQGMI